jgi:hypothetical protein
LRGKDLFKELGHLSWMGLWLYGITGREFSPNQLRLFEGIWSVSTSFPDPRLWNNRIAALAASARSTPVLGMGAATAVSEAIIYGHQPLLAAYSFLEQTLKQQRHGHTLSDILGRALASSTEGKPGSGPNRCVAKIPGFGRPLVSRDERLDPLLELARRLALADGDFLKLAQDIENTLQEMGQDLRMNVATLMASLSADMGLNSREYYHYVSLCFSAGMMPCAIDAQRKPEGAFFPLRCERIDYHGPAPRTWRREST